MSLLILSTTAGCQGIADKKREERTSAGTTADHQMKKVDSTKLIIPGERAGSSYLGQDMKAVAKLLGTPDDGDAAMGTALGIWYTKKGVDSAFRRPITIFSSYKDSTMVAKSVKQVSVSTPEYSTTAGVHTGLKLSELRAAFPSLENTNSYVKGKDTLFVFDDRLGGIAFDVQQDTCNAITIHRKGNQVNSTYLDVHPGWKNLARK